MSREEQRRILHNLDRIEDRLRDAPEGLHEPGEPADPEVVEGSGLDPDVALLWATYDGLELGGGECRILPLAEQPAATAAAREEGRLRPGDRVIGERGRDLYVLCADPHAEGADVVLVEEDGERLPFASSVDRLVLALLGEFAVLYDEGGEFQEDLFGEDGELTPVAERRLLRRHLDLDPDAPLARFRLAQSLRRSGELRGAAAELKQLLRRAPEFAWGHHELGRVRLAEQRPAEAAGSFRRAAEAAGEPGLRGHFLAWACLALQSCPPEQAPKFTRPELAAAALAAAPGLPAAQEAAVRDALANDDLAAADEQLSLGLAVSPGHLGLLSLRPALEELRARRAAEPAGDDAPLEPDPDADLDPNIRDDELQRLAEARPARDREPTRPAPDRAREPAPKSARPRDLPPKPARPHEPAPKSARPHPSAGRDAPPASNRPRDAAPAARRDAPAKRAPDPAAKPARESAPKSARARARRPS